MFRGNHWLLWALPPCDAWALPRPGVYWLLDPSDAAGGPACCHVVKPIIIHPQSWLVYIGLWHLGCESIQI